MALELPTPADLDQLQNVGLTQQQALVQAADLFTLATGVSDTPSDPFEKRLVRDAILQMAWALRARQEDLEAVFSPFSTERIGSYSYSKMVENWHSAARTKTTGVPLFDSAVAYFNGRKGSATATAVSEQVFKHGESWAGETSWNNHDPAFVVYKP